MPKASRMTLPQVPDGATPTPHHVYVDRETLRRSVGDPGGPEADEALDYATISGSRWVDHHLGDNAWQPGDPIEEVPIEFPLDVVVVAVDSRVRSAALVAAIRHMRSADIPFSVAGGFGDLATRIVADIPEAAMLLRGLRQTWGVG